MRRLMPLTASLVLLAALPACARERLPADVLAVLDAAEDVELYSLDPSRDPKVKAAAKEKFRGWKALGKTALKDKKTRALVLDALKKGIADSDGSVAGCFNPRHGIRATHKGKTVELVICFECLSMGVYGGAKDTSVLTTGSPQATFDKVLKAAKVPLPEKAKD